MNSTPTGIPILHCEECDRTHPITRNHCVECGIASAFIDEFGHCLAHHRTP